MQIKFSLDKIYFNQDSGKRSKKRLKGILYEIYDHCSEVFLRLESKIGTVRSGQNNQKWPRKLGEKLYQGPKEVAQWGVKRGGAGPGVSMYIGWYDLNWFPFQCM